MTASSLFVIGAALCAICSAVVSVLIAADVNRRGTKTSLPLMRWHFFRNIGVYRAETIKEAGKAGPLFYWFVVPINAAWVLAILALVIR